jgi:FAD/FMN-containing dehydrogenase
MDSIIEHDAANLTVTAEAGLSLDKLQQKLSEAGQFLPLDAPPDSTLGSIVAAALPGPRRHIYGSVRDLVLGLSFASADGQIIKAGGKTVKNVAGYDFGKLLIGSWGSLGAITEITFRIMPIPKASGGFIASFPNTDNAFNAAANIIRSKLNPAIVTLLNARAASRLTEGRPPTPLSSFVTARDRAPLLFLGAEGFPAAIEKQLAHMQRICTENSAEVSDRVAGEEYRPLLAAVTSLCYPPRFPFIPLSTIMSICISVPCGEIARTVGLMGVLETECGVSAHVIAHVSGGSVYSHFLPEMESFPVEMPAGIHAKLRAGLPNASIAIIALHHDAVIDMPLVCGNHAPASWLNAIKKCLDPAGLIS